MLKRGLLAPGAAGVLIAACAVSAHAQTYSAGFRWNREADWVPGPVPGLPVGNPAPDALGSPVYGYEWTIGEGLGSEFPWFENPGVQLVWDNQWFGSGQSAWVRADDVNPPIFRNRLTHNLIGTNFDFIPALRWSNPVPGGTTLDITGNLTVLWSGNNFSGAPTDVDVVISIFDPEPDNLEILYAATVSKPNPGLTVGDIVELDVDLRQIMLDEGAIVSVSLRAHDRMTGEGRWVVLFDYGLDFTIVPAPGGLVLIPGLAGVIAWRRRR